MALSMVVTAQGLVFAAGSSLAERVCVFRCIIAGARTPRAREEENQPVSHGQLVIREHQLLRDGSRIVPE